MKDGRRDIFRKGLIAGISMVAVVMAVDFASAQFVSPTCIPPNCNPQVIQNIELNESAQTASFNITGDGGVGTELQVGTQAPVLSGGAENLIYGNVGGASSAGSLLLLQNGGSDVLRVGITGDSTLSGSFGLPAGSAGAPSLYFGGDTNTGIYSSGADSINFTTGGTQAFSVAGDNTVTFLGDVNLSSVSGDGSGLTNINADNITSGTVNNARLSSNVALTDQANTFSALQTYTPNTNEEGIRVISSNYSPLVIRNTADDSDLFRVTENGYVGVALGGAPGYPLTVGGTVYSQGDIYANRHFMSNTGFVGTPSLTWLADTNTGIYRPAADSIALTAGGSEGFRVTSTAVSIPAGKTFTVGGQSVCLGDGSNCPPAEFSGTGTGNGLVGYIPKFNSATSVQNSIMYQYYYIGHRRIGINDTAPDYVFEVQPNNGQSGLARFQNDGGNAYVDITSSTTGDAHLRLGNSSVIGRADIWYDNSTNELKIENYSGLPAVTIDNNNSVAMSYDLDVGGDLDVAGEARIGHSAGSGFNGPALEVDQKFGGSLPNAANQIGLLVQSGQRRSNSAGYTYTGTGIWATADLMSSALADIDTMYGIYGAVNQQDNEHAVGTAYGIYGAVNATGSGGMTTAYAGYFKGNPSASNNWALYTRDGLVQIDDDATPNTPSVANGAGDLYVVGDLEVGGSIIGGSGGTENAVPKFDSGGALTESSISDDGTSVTVTNENLIATGTFSFGSSVPVSGAGARMMWLPGKGAFRAGTVSGTEWDTVNVGDYSVAFGDRNIASGEVSFAAGIVNEASGYNSIAIGESTQATNSGSIAIGQGSTLASGVNALALGPNATASGPVSLAWGDLAVASGGNAIALGSSAVAGGSYSIALLDGVTTGDWSMAFGGSAQTGGLTSLAMSTGGDAIANGANSVAIGAAVRATGSGSFIIGRGVSNASYMNNGYANSLMVGFNSTQPTLYVGPSAGGSSTGEVGIGTWNTKEKLTVAGNIYTSGKICLSQFDCDAGTNSIQIYNPLGTGAIALKPNSASGSGVNIYDYSGDGYGHFQAYSNVFTMGFKWAGAAISMNINNEVGINYTSPKRALHVHDPGSFAGIKVTNSTTNQQASDGIDLQVSGYTGYLWNYEPGGMYIGTNNNWNMYLQTDRTVDYPSGIGVGNYGGSTSYGIMGQGPTAGAFFRDSNNTSSYTYGGYGGYGTYSQGTTAGGFFRDGTTTSSYGYVGYGSYGGYFRSATTAVYGYNSTYGSSGRLGYSSYGGYMSGNLYVSGSCSGGGSCNEDLAEYLDTDGGPEAGDVVIIGEDGLLEKSSEAYSTNVAGVISTNPAIVMPGGDEGDELKEGRQPLALAGVAPVKVIDENGAVKPGDLLTTSSTEGHAMRCEDRDACSGAVIGKALEAMKGSNDIINMIVTLH